MVHHVHVSRQVQQEPDCCHVACPRCDVQYRPAVAVPGLDAGAGGDEEAADGEALEAKGDVQWGLIVLHEPVAGGPQLEQELDALEATEGAGDVKERAEEGVRVDAGEAEEEGGEVGGEVGGSDGDEAAR
eukprot:763665-Hanusia_phi.AAC.2